jgi:tungstate transport system ATP-binding protein
MSTLVEIQELSVRRQERQVLSIDRMEIEEGEILAVIGPNGAGKSTLLLALAHLLQPATGRILFRGQPVARDLEYRRRIALVLQDPLLMSTSVYENVAAGLRFRRLPRPIVDERVRDWLHRLGIESLGDRSAPRLSGGEAQRASLARAMVLQPELLLLDEPFGALDAPTRARLIDDLHLLLKSTATTTVFVTHDQDEAMLLGDRVAVLLGGYLRQIGPPEAIFSTPADAEVAAFVGIETIIPGQVTGAHKGTLTIQAHGFTLEAAGSLAPGRSVLVCLRPEDIALWTELELGEDSADNRLAGRILRMTPQGPLVRVTIDCGFPPDSGFPLVSLVTRTSARQMGLVEGQPVTATFKTSAAHLIPQDQHGGSAPARTENRAG